MLYFPPVHRQVFSRAWALWWRGFMGLLLWCCGGMALAQAVTPEVMRLAITPDGQSLQGRVEWLEDPQGTLTIDEVRQPAVAERFVRSPGVPRTAGRDQVVWLRVPMEQSAPSGDWLVAFPTTAIHALEFHGPWDATGTLLAPAVVTGLSQPYVSRPLASERYVHRLQLPAPGLYTVYLRVQTNTPKSLDLVAWDTATYLQVRQHKRLFDGLCYGILFTLMAYNLSLAWGLRDRTAVFYVLSCVAAFLTLATYNGHTARYFWPASPWWIERSYVLAPALWISASALFAGSFLSGRGRFWRLTVTVWALVAAGAVAFVSGLLNQMALGQTLIEWASLLGVLLMASVAYSRWRRGYRPALWYLGGQLAFFAAVCSTVLVNWGWLDAPFLLANGLQIGVALEMLVFAMALSARVALLQQQQMALRIETEQWARVASTDPLTGLLNRHGLSLKADQILSQSGQHALMLIDLDRFKPINDTYGHEAGDKVLVELGRRMRSLVRERDVVARLGGDEFVVLLADSSAREEQEALAQRLVQVLSEPVALEVLQVQLGGSVGVACAAQANCPLKDLIHAADQAMYRAKHTRGSYAFYDPAQDAPIPSCA